jgi:hypothetical protein
VRDERVDVAHAPVDHQPDDAAGLRARGEHLAPVPELANVADVDREGGARRRARDRDVDPEVVARRAPYGVRRRSDGGARPGRSNPGAHASGARLPEGGRAETGQRAGELGGLGFGGHLRDRTPVSGHRSDTQRVHLAT